MKWSMLIRLLVSPAMILFLAGIIDQVPDMAMADALVLQEPGTKVVTLRVEGMTCATCPLTVRRALKRLPGVVEAKVYYPEGIARVTYREGEVSVDQIVRTISNLGYPASLESLEKGDANHGR